MENTDALCRFWPTIKQNRFYMREKYIKCNGKYVH